LHCGNAAFLILTFGVGFGPGRPTVINNVFDRIRRLGNAGLVGFGGCDKNLARLKPRRGACQSQRVHRVCMGWIRGKIHRQYAERMDKPFDVLV